MKISIITPSYNQSKYIGKTIDSVLSQNCPDVEYIVMDGGSKDGTVGILENAKCQISNAKSKNITFKWISKKDRGQVDAINKGLKMATGDILGYINSDDYYEPDALRTVVSFFEDHPDVMWLTGDCRIVDAKGREIQKFVKWYKKILRYFPLSMVLPILNPVAQPSTFWRKEVLKKIGNFDEHLQYAFDYDYWIRLIKRYPPMIKGDTFSNFRIHEKSKGGKEYPKQFAEELEIIRHYIKNRFVLWLHSVHNTFIICIYNKIK